ncbi:ParB/RepB/Spo0J family partition protein [Actinoallomurus vinaceus]|uniref:ParB/RepB/Spo0J family partition protein n=1 Tax=Actinoallomurus vinaceus TaxID=1080074 RepID=UPI0031E9F524
MDSLLPADSPRLAGEDAAHTQVLAGLESRLPPILVHRETMRVIDGMHRLMAAKMCGSKTIEVRFFDGTETMAFLLAVKSNITHGLPLSLADREAAAARIVSSQPEWSDRAIGAATGLSAKTVGAIRQRATADSPQLHARIGRDGRVRPLDASQGRLRASEIIRDRPDAALREIAREAGISVGTARDVRERIKDGRDPLPLRQRATERSAAGPIAPAAARPAIRPPLLRRARRSIEVIDWGSTREKLRADPALKYAESGRQFLRWFDAHVVGLDDWKLVVDAVPPHWANDIVVLARYCSDRWLDIARQVEQNCSTL